MMRRRLLNAIKPLPENYVQDGLVLWLDGLNRGNVSGQWIDLIDSNVVTLTSPYTELVNGIQFDGDGYGTFGSQLLIPSNQGTIEVCYRVDALNSTLQPIVCMGGTFKLGCAITYTTSNAGSQIRYYYSGSGSGGKTWLLNDDLQIVTASANDDFCIANAKKEGYLFDSYFTSYITRGFASRGAGNGKFHGIIYSVRMYNRKLTKNEAIENQRLDNYRYNLGLNI